MALTVQQANPGTTNLTATQIGNPTLTGVAVAHPGTLTNNVIKPAAQTTAAPNSNSQLAAQIAALTAQANAASRQVYAPALDTNAIFNQAGATANANVNPYYSKLLNDFISQQAQARTLQQSNTATTIKNLQDQLAEINAGNVVTGNRATEDTATAEAGINQAADYRQVDQGTQFNGARTTEAGNIAQAGLTASGLGAGQQATTEANHLTTEARQATADQQSKDAAELSKARTFEDIATSNKNAAAGETRGETQANFDLNAFILNQSSDLQNKQQDLESQRVAAVQNEQQNQVKLAVNKFINSIANPAQRQAALQAYGAYL